MKKIIIWLQPKPSWVLIDNESIIEITQEGDCARLEQAAQGCEVIVVIPAEDVLLASAALPKMNRHRLSKAVPYVLEEQLTEEVEALHFALGEQQAEQLPVAVVSHAKMQQWLMLLQSWNIKADKMIPASLTLPLDDKTWHIALHRMAVLRLGAYRGFACDITNLPEFLTLLCQEEEQPETIHIHNYTQEAFVCPLKMQPKMKEDLFSPAQMIADLSLNVVRTPAINLLQGPYAVKKSKFVRQDKILRVMFGLAAAWVVLLFLYPTISYFILQKRVSIIDTQMREIYKRQFPQSNSMVAPKLRMEEKLQKATTAVGQNHLLLLLGYVGKGMAKAPGIKLKHIDFQNNQLTLELTASSSEEFSMFTDFLAQQRLLVKQQNANLIGSRINATLEID